MCRLKCLQTAISSKFVAYYFFWLMFCSSWCSVYGLRLGTLSNDDEEGDDDDYVCAKSGPRPLFTGKKERKNVNLRFARQKCERKQIKLQYHGFFSQRLQELFLLSHSHGLLNDEELLLLYEERNPQNPDFPYYGRFSLEEFRFRKHDLPLLAEAFQLPDSFTCYQRSVASGMEGLCILLRRLSYPCRYSDMLPRFGRPVPVLSMISSQVLNYVYDVHSHRVTQWNHEILSPQALQPYSNAIAAVGATLNNCIGFVEDTVRPICRPGEHQRAVYNGHKRVHALKFQCVALPNGLVGHLNGPVEGRRHDAGMLADSALLNDLQAFANSPLGNPYCIYGDPAYPLRVHLIAPFRSGVLIPPMMAFNQSMSTVRESVEWLFNDITNYFKFLDFKKNLKIGLSSVGKMYVVGALVRNALTYLYGSQTSRFFQFDPPSLQQYFASLGQYD